MNVSEKINLLKKFKNVSYPILTVYLSSPDLKTATSLELKRQFLSLLTRNLTKVEKKHFRDTIRNINEYLEESFDSRGKRSIAFFGNGDLFEILEFEFPLPQICKVSNSMYLTPILDQAIGHNRYLVLLVDRKKARIFTVYLGEIEEYKDVIVDIVPQKVRASEERFYGRSDKIFRHIENHLNRHLKTVAEKVKEFIQGKRINFIIIGGHKEIFEKLKKHLPKYIIDKVEGEFVTELNIPLNDAYLASKKVAEHIEQEKAYGKMEESLAGA